MDFIESSLCRLQNSVGRFVVPSVVLQSARALKAQIELRQRALRDIEVIRSRLRPFMPCEGKGLQRRLRTGGASRPRLGNSVRAGRVRGLSCF